MPPRLVVEFDDQGRVVDIYPTNLIDLNISREEWLRDYCYYDGLTGSLSNDKENKETTEKP